MSSFIDEHKLVSELAFAVRDRVREICRSLPGAEEKIDGMGHTVFKVRAKSFVILSEGVQGGGGRCFIKCDKETQQLLIHKGPYVRAPYIGQHGWVMIHCKDIEDWDEFDELVKEAYLRSAPKKLVEAYLRQER